MEAFVFFSVGLGSNSFNTHPSKANTKLKSKISTVTLSTFMNAEWD